MSFLLNKLICRSNLYKTAVMLSKKKKSDSTSLKITREMKNINPTVENFQNFISEKVSRIYDIIQKTILSIQRHKLLDIFSNSDLISALDSLNDLYNKTLSLSSKKVTSLPEIDVVMADLQFIFDKLSMVIFNFGTRDINDILYVTIGGDFDIKEKLSEEIVEKLELLKYVSFIGYKILTYKSKQEFHSSENESPLCCDKIVENNINLENSNQLECYDPIVISRSFHHSIFGIRIAVKNEKDGKILLLSGSVDDISIDWLSENKYIKSRKLEIEKLVQNKNNQDIDVTIMNRLLESFTLKDILVLGKGDIYKKYITLMKDVQFAKTNRIETIIKYFTDMDVIHQRKMIINLLIYNKDLEIQYIAYMLYDLISTTGSDSIHVDSTEQKIIYDSFPWKIKIFFKEAMKNTIQYSQETLNKADMNRVSLEQQIVLMRTNESIKDRAIAKLKEIKGKPDDQGNKAKQYLEGLLRIPFGIYKVEPVLKIIGNLNKKFIDFSKVNGIVSNPKKKYTAFEMSNYLRSFENSTTPSINEFIRSYIGLLNKASLLTAANFIDEINNSKAKISKKTKKELIEFVNSSLGNIENSDLKYKLHKNITAIGGDSLNNNPMHQYDVSKSIGLDIKKINDSIVEITQTLDNSIYGHTHAKTQILKIIAQWINGEQSGYCFGFEGSPGVGKTSLAKRGLAKCLQDEIGESRPFAFIALGGSCNGSTLEGHNYTYVNAQWGKIVDILMETKCMNPIIYIDELDKVSKTEQGKEIIGILTHLIDYTQNDEFQDKYFSGIPIDLSKALFIFSYNDPEQIDRILLDRIHRIKFDNLSSDDKRIIVNDFVLPEINRKMGFDNIIELPKETIDYIIEFYTMESGIRKLKEILFDLYGEINIELLRASGIDSHETIEIPIIVQVSDLGKKYLKKYSRIHEKLVHSVPTIGVINGLWANALGKGGIIPIEVSFFPSSTFLELKLTGLQGDVMKESMNIAKTVAWTLTSDEIKRALMEMFETTKNQGLHIHCPEGAVSKDGPSAGAAITLSIYSLFNKIKISNTIAITGEINLQGNITAIGGLDVKIMGGMRAGVKKFMYPKENQRDFEDCHAKHKDFFEERGIEFQDVSQIQDVFQHVYETENNR